MKIVTWKELDGKEEITPLIMMAFGSPFNPKVLEKTIRLDPRLNRSAIGLCAIEDGHLIGFVGLMDLTTRSIDGTIEPAGGIWAVSTLPSHARKGASTRLMNEAHQHFRDKHYRFSFLMTRRTLIAYHLYQKLGYEDVMDFPSAYKLIPSRRAVRKMAKDSRPDWRRILDLYNRYTAARTGFVVRDVGYFKMQQKRVSIDFECEEKVMVGDKGYAFFGEAGKSLHIDELVPNDEDRSVDLIREIEGKAKGLIYDRMILTGKLLQAYDRLGYMTHSSSHSLLMAKSLATDTTFKETYSDRFYMTLVDSF
jgi:GNAT superfamily N-acetyltransferase